MDVEKVLQKLRKNTRINPETGCWEFLSTNNYGYGRTSVDAKLVLVHVLSAKIFLGYQPSLSSMVCHKTICKSRACWNPDHLYLGDASSNEKDKWVAGAPNNGNNLKTHCHKGHEFTPENTYWARRKNGSKMRNCRACSLANSKAWQKRRALKLVRKVG